ncbi:transcription factor GTE9-like [Panicum miliaceum]|uniref:Transcription factor GTE9-like n=1 Tax=Panicum miliaceum TaxID=4540 RepID=A0A3L6QRC6_PANMI|nr:transcription factor GTE9-like [Panicum miliaceum]
MNVSKTRLCGKILKKLMDHKGGWLFHKPVDPVLYGIPDYFDVIRNPMDLGTVKKKLSDKKYVMASEFAADMRLTFANAMKYNPPGNHVHAVAEQLNRIFDSEWRSVIRKWNVRNPVQEQKPMKATKPQAAMKLKSLITEGLVTCSNSLAKEPSINAISSKENDKISRTQSNENRVLSNGEESYVHLEPLSPSKALRIAMLKSRFAGTIVKAQQNALLDHGKEVDIAKLQLEKERLEKRQQEEKARIEAQVKAAEAAAQLKVEEEIRMKREKERKAARLALHMMKKTVDIDNSDFLKDLENLCQKWQLNPPSKLIVDFVRGIELPEGLGSPLEALGLFIKKDLEEEVDHEMGDSVSTSLNADVEEGEISCSQ